jgi:uracil phosphoribosyltransferase
VDGGPAGAAGGDSPSQLPRFGEFAQEDGATLEPVPDLLGGRFFGSFNGHANYLPSANVSIRHVKRWLGTFARMETLAVAHPLVAHKLTTLRDVRTDSPTFRRLADELVTLLAYEATRDVRVVDTTVDTPLQTTEGVRLARPAPLVVPILRAGLGMLDGMTRLLPTAEVGFLGMIRDEGSLQAQTYATRLPDDLSGRQCYVLDPMLATGGTLAAAIQLLLARGARDVTALCLLAAPEGLKHLEDTFAGTAAPIRVVTAAIDSQLNENGFIVPGLGDAGDRLYGVV